MSISTGVVVVHGFRLMLGMSWSKLDNGSFMVVVGVRFQPLFFILRHDMVEALIVRDRWEGNFSPHFLLHSQMEIFLCGIVSWVCYLRG